MTCRMSPSCSTSVSASSELPAYARITAYMVATSFRLVDQQSFEVSHDRTPGREHPTWASAQECPLTIARLRARSCLRSPAGGLGAVVAIGAIGGFVPAVRGSSDVAD